MDTRMAFVLMMVTLLAGLAVLIQGVIIDTGMKMNTPMIAGGVLILVATGLLSWLAMKVEGPDEAAH